VLGHAEVHADKILGQCGIGGNATQSGLPGVQVCVDQARDDDAPSEVDDFGVGSVLKLADIGDAVIFDQDVDAFCVGAVCGHGGYLRSAQQNAAHDIVLGSAKWSKRCVRMITPSCELIIIG
jgi:hypothetical protein